MATRLTEYLEMQYRLNPTACMIEQEDERISFKQGYLTAVEIAYRIHEILNGKTNQPVIVYMEKSIGEYLALMGVLCSGNFYVPLDINMPEARLREILRTINSDIAISSANVPDRLLAAGYSGTILEIGEIEEGLTERSILQWTSRIIDTDPAYVLFTSGSTGIPKGVVVSQRAVIDYIEWQCKALPFDQNSVLGGRHHFILMHRCRTFIHLCDVAAG